MIEPSREALALHDEAYIIDLHADTLELVSALGYDLTVEHGSSLLAGHTLGHVDLPRMRRGGLTAQCFGIVIPPWSTPRSALAKVKRQGELARQLSRTLADDMVRVTTAESIEAAKKSGRIAVMIGVEGSHGLVNDDNALDELNTQDVTYMGPAHLFDSGAGHSHYWHRGAGGALPAAGLELVEGLEARSILVDLAHMARGPFLEICRRSRRPLLVSHTGVSGVYRHWRNIDDEQVRAVADLGGVIGVIMTPRYLGRPGVEGVVEHLEHILDVGGEDTPALGSDFDGLVKPPRDILDASGLPKITDCLLRRGHKERIIRKILGENVLRLLRSNEKRGF